MLHDLRKHQLARYIDRSPEVMHRRVAEPVFGVQVETKKICRLCVSHQWLTRFNRKTLGHYWVVIETWFPGFAQVWENHYRFVQSLCFTAGLFGTLIIKFWNRRHRGAFWGAMCIFFLIHVFGVTYYSMHTQPLVLRQWIILLILECGVVIFSVDWLTKWLGQLGKYVGKLSHSMGK